MNKFVCDCGKKYANKPNLCRHRRICTYDKKNVRIAELEQIIRVENNVKLLQLKDMASESSC